MLSRSHGEKHEMMAGFRGSRVTDGAGNFDLMEAVMSEARSGCDRRVDLLEGPLTEIMYASLRFWRLTYPHPVSIHQSSPRSP